MFRVIVVAEPNKPHAVYFIHLAVLFSLVNINYLT